MTRAKPGLRCRLAFGAEVGATAAHRYPLNGSAAVGTIFASPVGYFELEVGRAFGAVGAIVIFHTGTFITNPCP